jgi:hypothetical protein
MMENDDMKAVDDQCMFRSDTNKIAGSVSEFQLRE